VRDYVRAAAALEDPATGSISSSAIARRLGKSTAAVSTRRADLIATHQVLRSDSRDRLAFTQPGFGAWVRSLDPQLSRDQLGGPDPAAAADAILEGWRHTRPRGRDGPGIGIE
ncbi:MAG: hypothetical protein M3R09_04755, partial [Actinomycetota bacterium]|nr:hypothetical protein [Actinomycetota bacterium]